MEANQSESDPEMQDFISSIMPLALYLADEARQIIRPYFRQDCEVERKGDETPVTMADRNVEARLRQIVEKERPEDGIIGEEYGVKDKKNQYEWVFDPIDGTKSFIIGRPSFGTLIALCESGVPILGIIDQPILDERWIGVKGWPTKFNKQNVATKSCGLLKDAIVASTSPRLMPNHWHKFSEMCQFAVWGGDCYSYGLLANGGLDLVIEKGLNKYDFAAIPPIVEGAGGHMCDWSGAPLTLNSGDDIIAMSDIALKDQVLEMLNY